MWIKKIKSCAQLMRLHKPIGILLLLWPTLWALWLAGRGKPDLFVVMIFSAGVFVMRAAGCVMNDYADRNVDAHVARTRNRPLAAGDLQPRTALVIFALLMLAALVLVLQLNHFTLYLACVGAVLAITYPFMKRITQLPQLGLGVAFSWGVLMAFAALKNAVPAGAWLVFITAVIWPVIYDTMYAMTDRADDVKIGIKSTAILFGTMDKKIIAILQCLFLSGLISIGFYFHLSGIYYCSIVVSAALFIYQQFLIKHRDPQRCFQAFLNNNWVGLIIFAGIAGSESL
jgi:4-hydroxybenzoate polyprenyltransferase